MRFWTEKNLPAPEELRRIEVSERLRSPWERSDVFRLEVLWRFGGVYVDADLECLRPIEQLIGDATFTIGRSRRGRVDTSVLGAVARHPILDRALDEIQVREFHGYDDEGTGSRFLERVLAETPGVTYFDRALVDPTRPKDLEAAYAVGRGANWDVVERLWQSLLKSEKRTIAAQKEASHWKAKYTEEVAPKVAAGGGSEARAGIASATTPSRTATARIRLPRLFHEVWLGENPIPEEYIAYQQSWLRHHPDWELRLWTEENLPDSLRRPEAAERLRVPAERCDILRLEVVWRYGGVYLDTDLECLAPIGELIGEASFFTAATRSDTVDSHLFGAVAGHPILERALNQIRPQTSHGHKKTQVGPNFLDSVVADQRDEILFLRPETLKAYTTHHKHRTYMDSQAVRLDILKAKLAMLDNGEAAPSAPPAGPAR